MRLVEKYIDHVLDSYVTSVIGVYQLKQLPDYSAELENALLKKLFVRFLNRSIEFLERENSLLVLKNEKIAHRLDGFISQIEKHDEHNSEAEIDADTSDKASDSADSELPERPERPPNEEE